MICPWCQCKICSGLEACKGCLRKVWSGLETCAKYTPVLNVFFEIFFHEDVEPDDIKELLNVQGLLSALLLGAVCGYTSSMSYDDLEKAGNRLGGCYYADDSPDTRWWLEKVNGDRNHIVMYKFSWWIMWSQIWLSANILAVVWVYFSFAGVEKAKNDDEKAREKKKIKWLQMIEEKSLEKKRSKFARSGSSIIEETTGEETTGEKKKKNLLQMLEEKSLEKRNNLVRSGSSIIEEFDAYRRWWFCVRWLLIWSTLALILGVVYFCQASFIVGIMKFPIATRYLNCERQPVQIHMLVDMLKTYSSGLIFSALFPPFMLSLAQCRIFMNEHADKYAAYVNPSGAGTNAVTALVLEPEP